MIEASALSIAIKLIHQVNGVLPINIKEQDSLVKDLAMDSVELIDLFLRLEQIGVTAEESNISSALTVGDIARFINSAANK